jgi:hypothetical protein
MHPEEREFREENRFIASVAERVLRADPLLQPYLEDGDFKMVDRPEEEFMWFAPGLPAETRDFIRERAREVLQQKPAAGDEAARWLWEEREKVRKQLETDPELFPYILAGTLLIQNSAEGFKIEIAPEVPDEEAGELNERLSYVLALHFGIIPRPE